MEKRETFTYNLHEIQEVAQHLLSLLNGCRIMTFTGELGAGKTTLVKSMLRALGITDVITSPTFTYVNYYRLPGGKMLYHFDLYRIATQRDFILAGFDEYLADPDALIFIEWPGVIDQLLAQYPVCAVRLDHQEEEKRSITLGMQMPAR